MWRLWGLERHDQDTVSNILDREAKSPRSVGRFIPARLVMRTPKIITRYAQSIDNISA